MTRAVWLLMLTGATFYGLTGCALLTKNEPQVPRYFTPLDAEATASVSSTAARPAMTLRLGRVDAASSLRERIAYRTSDHEIRYYDGRRWTDRPTAYLERALTRSLFERYGLTMVVSGAAPTLLVELTAFEEIRDKPHRARVEVTIVMEHAGRARLHETIRHEENITDSDDDEAEAVVKALSLALNQVVERVAARSVATLDTLAQELAAEEAAAKAEANPTTITP